MKIYTRGGDTGETSLFGGGRVAKDDARVQALGDVDELNAVLGWAIAGVTDDGVRAALESIQHDLFALGAELATPRRPRQGEPDRRRRACRRDAPRTWSGGSTIPRAGSRP